jgi:hypothetical protein
VFIPALLDDNKILQKNDPNYEAKLAASGSKQLYKAWRFGNWDEVSGQYFDVFDESKHTVRVIQYGEPGSDPRDVKPGTAVIAPWHQKWISMDWGFQDDTVVLWHSIDENRRVVTYRELVINRTEPVEIGELIVANTRKDEKISFFTGHCGHGSSRGLAAYVPDASARKMAYIAELSCSYRVSSAASAR